MSKKDRGPICAIAGRACPRTSDPQAAVHCPAWWELAGEDATSGQPSVKKGCAFTFLPLLLLETMGASRSAAAAVESTRNEIVRGFGHVGEVFADTLAAAKARPEVKAISG